MQTFCQCSYWVVRLRSTGKTSRAALLALCGSAFLAASGFAAPAEEISQAVTVNGIADVTAARPKQFLKAFTAVALRANPRDLPNYVIAAINLRPDLAPNIVAVAVKAATKNWERKPAALCAVTNRIINAAIAANPDGVVLIVKAGAAAAPELRHCVVTGAISAAPMAKDAIIHAATTRAVPFAFLTFSAADTSRFSFTAATLSPANISDLRDNAVTSPEQPPSP